MANHPGYKTSSNKKKKYISTEDITRFTTLINTKELPKLIPDFPCHTRAVERLSKLVTEASTPVVGNEVRAGYIETELKVERSCQNLKQKTMQVELNSYTKHGWEVGLGRVELDMQPLPRTEF